VLESEDFSVLSSKVAIFGLSAEFGCVGSPYPESSDRTEGPGEFWDGEWDGIGWGDSIPEVDSSWDAEP